MYLFGNLDGKDSAVCALLNLKGSGFSPADLDVFSEQPVELPKGVLDRKSKMSLVVVMSAIVFGLLVIAFVSYTQHNYRLVTGGMPIFSFWATGVVFYELTMLGAIVSTFCWFLWESGLVRRKRAPVPDIDAGIICLRVRCTPEKQDVATRQLRSAGALDIRSIEETT